MKFCPKCGAELKPAQAPAEVTPPVAAPAPAPPSASYRPEKAEKREKEEKQEKQEKKEKGEHREMREFAFGGPLIGGFFLIIFGFFLYLSVTGQIHLETFGGLFLVLIGLVVIIGAIYAATTAMRRHPRT